MKLIHLKKKNDSYFAKVEEEKTVLGIRLFKRIYKFILPEKENYWCYAKSEKRVSVNHQKYLEQCLHDHKRFIEKQKF